MSVVGFDDVTFIAKGNKEQMIEIGTCKRTNEKKNIEVYILFFYFPHSAKLIQTLWRARSPIWTLSVRSFLRQFSFLFFFFFLQHALHSKAIQMQFSLLVRVYCWISSLLLFPAWRFTHKTLGRYPRTTKKKMLNFMINRNKSEEIIFICT